MSLVLHKSKATTDFVIVGHPQQYEVNQVFLFWQGRPHKPVLLGSYVGNINNPDFANKINRVRGRLWLKNVNYSEAPSALVVKEIKRMNDVERYNRKMSRVFNEFWRRIDLCTGLFREDQIKDLSERYKQTVVTLKKRYGI